MAAKTETFPVQKSDAEWQKELDPQQFNVLRKHATERAGTSPLNFEKRKGEFRCAGCGTPCSIRRLNSRAAPAGRRSGRRSTTRSARRPIAASS
jgi:glutamine synthetase type III